MQKQTTTGTIAATARVTLLTAREVMEKVNAEFQTPEKATRPYGARARVGLIVPAPNTVAETEFWRLVPVGMNVHTTRMLVRPGRQLVASPCPVLT